MYMQNSRPVLLAILFLFCVPAHSQDWCNSNSLSSQERAICGNRDLGSREIEMSKRYKSILRDEGQSNEARKYIKDTQSVWLKARGQCGSDAGCIGMMYDIRIRELLGYLNAGVDQ